MQIEVSTVQALDALTPAELSDSIQECAREFESLRYRVGCLLNEADTRKVWLQIGFPSKAAWLDKILPPGVRRSTAYQAARQVREHPYLPPAEFAQIPSENLDSLKYLPERQRQDPILLQQAKQMDASAFKEFLNAKYELHLTPGKRVVFKFEDIDQASDVEIGIQNYIKTNGGTRENALWNIVGENWI